jgi:hypothetical protein
MQMLASLSGAGAGLALLVGGLVIIGLAVGVGKHYASSQSAMMIDWSR